nr:hypothetical protein [Tanacetum cinerariifolium]
MGDEHLDTIPATESDEVIKSSVEDLVPIPSEFKGIPDTLCDVHLVNNPTPLEAKDQFEIVINSNDDYSSSDDDSLYYENIEYVKASPHDSEFVSLEVEKIVIPEDEEIEDDNLHEKLLKGTNTFHNSLPEFENFCFDLEEISSGSTTTQSDISLPEYDSFIFDLSNDQFPPTGRSDFTHEEFGDEPAHIISLPEYDCFYFGNFPDPGQLISSLNFAIRKNLSSTTCVNSPIEDDHSPLLAYVVKENQEKDKIGSKSDKNGKRVEAGKSLKQFQLKEEEKPKKTKKEWPKTHTRSKSYSTFKDRRKDKGLKCYFLKVQPQGPRLPTL